MDKLSYAWGLAMGKQLQAMGVKDINAEDFRDGVKIAFDGGEPALSVEEAQKLINDYLQDLEKKAEAVAREVRSRLRKTKLRFIIRASFLTALFLTVLSIAVSLQHSL